MGGGLPGLVKLLLFLSHLFLSRCPLFKSPHITLYLFLSHPFISDVTYTSKTPVKLQLFLSHPFVSRCDLYFGVVYHQIKILQIGDMSDPFLYLSKFLYEGRGRANLLRNRCDKDMCSLIEEDTQSIGHIC